MPSDRENEALGTIEAEVSGVAAAVLGCAVTPATTRASEPAWDSLKHIELLFALEDELAVRFDEDELASLDSLEAIAASVARHRGTP